MKSKIEEDLLGIRMLYFLRDATRLLKDQTTNAPELRHERSKGGFCMNEPVTKLDPRYSGPDGVATPWEETRRVLETAELFWLSVRRVGAC
jgi:hypothetical protein